MENTTISQKVAEHYSKYPYPDPDIMRIHGIEKIHTICAPKGWRGNFLVVGCGTIEACLVANQNPEASVTGIDLSRPSIQIAKSIRRHYKLKNLILFQGDILDDVFREKEFDFIVATGVLHHIKDIGKAVERIHAIAKPEGYLTGMVYADDRPQYIKQFCESRFKNLNAVRTILDEWKPNWYKIHTKDDAELADTWMHPYFTEYNEEILAKTLVGFNVVEAHRASIGKLIFISRKAKFEPKNKGTNKKRWF